MIICLIAASIVIWIATIALRNVNILIKRLMLHFDLKLFWISLWKLLLAEGTHEFIHVLGSSSLVHNISNKLCLKKGLPKIYRATKIEIVEITHIFSFLKIHTFLLKQLVKEQTNNINKIKICNKIYIFFVCRFTGNIVCNSHCHATITVVRLKSRGLR